MIEYNEGQLYAAQRITQHASRYAPDPITLIGPGGTGKTTTVMKSVDDVTATGGKVLLLAPTNKAVKVMEEALLESGLHHSQMGRVQSMTFHKALGLAVFPAEDKKQVAQKGTPVLEHYDLVVIDECSMLGRIAVHRYLMPVVEQCGASVVFMGDDKQLPPVKEGTVSPVFTEFEVMELTQPMRQKAGSAILEVCGALRAAMDSNHRYQHEPIEAVDVEVVKSGKFKAHIVDKFKENPNTQVHRALAWRNSRVKSINDAVRAELFGKDAGPFVKGENVVVGEPVKDAEDNIMIATDEECIVTYVDENVTMVDEVVGDTWKHTALSLRTSTGATHVVRVLHPEEVGRMEQRLDRFRQARNWKAFWALKELFHDIRYTYCITVHRSQGSTYDNVYVDVEDILGNKNRMERQRLLYVAFSRPRHHLVINKLRYSA